MLPPRGSPRTTDVPHRIVLAAAYPGQFHDVDISRLRCLAPLARIINVVGSWCEGEPRSGTPNAAVSRIYWHQFAARMATASMAAQQGQTSFWSQPATATEAEAIQRESSLPLTNPPRFVVIHSAQRCSSACLADLCRSVDVPAVVVNPDDGPFKIIGAGAGIFDSRHFQRTEQRELSRLVARISPAPAYLLANFPRQQDVRRAHACGASGVISKPFRVADLLSTISRPPDTPQIHLDPREHAA